MAPKSTKEDDLIGEVNPQEGLEWEIFLEKVAGFAHQNIVHWGLTSK